VVFDVYLSVQSRLGTRNPPLHIAFYVSGKGEKSENAVNKQYFVCILCGDNFVMRRINTILDAQIAEKEKYVFIQ